jgi:HEPN superfamily RiboL-PSP-like protein
MSYRSIEDTEKRIERIFDKARTIDSDPELLSHLARYLCVLISGYLETSIRTIYGHYAKSNSNSNVADFVGKRLRSFQNPSVEKILQLTYSFNTIWGDSLKNRLKGETADAVNSIVANKNLIAHGTNVGITIGSIGVYYSEAREVIAFIERLCA